MRNEFKNAGQLCHSNFDMKAPAEEEIFMGKSVNQRKEILSKNIEFVGFDDIYKKAGFQMAMQKQNGKYYLYAASFRWNGIAILDVTDPANPRKIQWMESFWPDDTIHDGMCIPKIQIADGLMILAHSGTMDVLHGTPKGNPLPFWGGISIWDVKTDPENPRMLSKFACGGGPGAHRFYYGGGRYLYVTGSCEGYAFFILRILDIQDPEHPVEVGRWWHDAQYLGNKPGGQLPPFGSEEFLNIPQLHACACRGDIVYMAYQNVGLIMLDVKDRSNPVEISTLNLNLPFGGGSGGARTHTVLPLGDLPYVLVSTEAERCHYFSEDDSSGLYGNLVTNPMNMLGIAEITDPSNPCLISVFPYPEMPDGYTHGKNFNYVDGLRVAFGPHNSFDAFGPDAYQKYDNRIYTCYFHAGLRIFDTSDLFMPKEIGYFLTPDPEKPSFDNDEGTLMPGPIVGIAEDVLVDDRGYIYFDTANDGLYIVRCTV